MDSVVVKAPKPMGSGAGRRESIKQGGNMTVAKLIEAFVAGMGWEDEIEVREKYEDRSGLRVTYSKALTIENQPFHLTIDAIEEYEWIILGR